MAFQEKSNWVVLIVGVPTLLLYLIVVVPQVVSQPLEEVDWVPPMLVAIVGFIVANILGNIVAAISNPREADQSDERDREIDHVGERVGTWLIAAGSFAGLVLAMADADPFWIANVIYLGFVLSAVVGSAAKVVAYRRGLPQW